MTEELTRYAAYERGDTKTLRRLVVKRKNRLICKIFRGADLSNLDLKNSNFSFSDLSGVNFTNSEMTGAWMYEVNLTGANLQNTCLMGAVLNAADLSRANLVGANLVGAELYGANLTGAILPDYQIPQACELEGFKAVANGLILKLMIPLDVARTGVLASNKCRAERAMVVGVYREDGVALTAGELEFTPLRSGHDYKFTYKVGEYAVAHSYEDDPRDDCAGGIHFFLKFEDAVIYPKNLSRLTL